MGESPADCTHHIVKHADLMWWIQGKHAEFNKEGADGYHKVCDNQTKRLIKLVKGLSPVLSDEDEEVFFKTKEQTLKHLESTKGQDSLTPGHDGRAQREILKQIGSIEELIESLIATDNKEGEGHVRSLAENYLGNLFLNWPANFYIGEKVDERATSTYQVEPFDTPIDTVTETDEISSKMKSLVQTKENLRKLRNGFCENDEYSVERCIADCTEIRKSFMECQIVIYDTDRPSRLRNNKRRSEQKIVTGDAPRLKLCDIRTKTKVEVKIEQDKLCITQPQSGSGSEGRFFQRSKGSYVPPPKTR